MANISWSLKPATGRPCILALVDSGTVSAHLPDDVNSTCVGRRLREQCLRSKITSVARVAHGLLLRFVAGNMEVDTFASKRSDLIGNQVDLCVLASSSCSDYVETQGRKLRPVAGFTRQGPLHL